MRRIKQILIVLILVMCNFFGIFIISPSVESEYTPHDPISINGDDDFAAQAASEGWPGDGTEGNPYVIEGYSINTSEHHGITVFSTTSYFIIRNSIITGLDGELNGILLYNVTNCTINNCVLANNHYGVLIFSSSYIKISECTFSSNDGRSVYSFDSSKLTITNNTMVDDIISIFGYEPEYWDTHNIDSTNTINGKPIYYWVDRSGGIVPLGAGQIILVNCTGVTIENQELTDLFYGLQIVFSTNNTIRNNTITSNEEEGIFLLNSSNNKIIRNILLSNEHGGVELENSNNNYISDNEITNCSYSIIMIRSTNNSLTNNTMIKTGIIISGYSLEHWNTHHINISNKVNGRPIYFWKNRNEGVVPTGAGQVFLTNCTNVTIEGQELTNSSIGIELAFCSNNRIVNNVVNSNKNGGIFLYFSHDNALINNHVSNAYYAGFYLMYSNRNVFTNNSVSDNHLGINLYYSNGNIVKDNNIFYNNISLKLRNSSQNSICRNNIYMNNVTMNCEYHSEKNNITENQVFYNEDGINIRSSNENIITFNNISGIIPSNIQSFSDHSIGINIRYSDNSTIMNNTIFNNSLGIRLHKSNGTLIKYNNISNNNGGISIGQSSGHSISYNNANSNNGSGFSLGYCVDSEILNNNALNNKNTGFQISHVYRSIIANNAALYNEDGFHLSTSKENRIIGNNFSSNEEMGIRIYNSSENEIINNLIFNNTHGFYIVKSSANTLHHNYIINNTFQVELSNSRNNVWDDGNGEGNYWSDYTGVDHDGDGIGDTKLPHQNVDYHPLTDKKSPILSLRWVFLILILFLIIIVIFLAWVIKRKRKPSETSSDKRSQESPNQSRDEVSQPKTPTNEQMGKE